MVRITRVSLEEQLRIINKRFEKPVYRLDRMGARWRLERDCDYVSPRLPTTLMYWWLDGFLAHTFIMKGEKQP